MSANLRALTTPPASGDTNTVPTCSMSGSSIIPIVRLMSFANTVLLVKSSTGISKNPCICPACKSIVSTLSAPATVIKLATSFAVIGVRLALLRSCLA